MLILACSPFTTKILGQFLEFITSVFCAGRELQLVEDWRRIATSMGGVWLHLQYQEMASCRSARKRALQQLTCMVGKDEYKEKSWSGDVNLVSIMIHLVVCLLSLCRLSIGQVLDVLTPVFCAGRDLVGD